MLHQLLRCQHSASASLKYHIQQRIVPETYQISTCVAHHTSRCLEHHTDTCLERCISRCLVTTMKRHEPKLEHGSCLLGVFAESAWHVRSIYSHITHCHTSSITHGQGCLPICRAGKIFIELVVNSCANIHMQVALSSVSSRLTPTASCVSIGARLRSDLGVQPGPFEPAGADMQV
jgi:hypothetical protein